MRALAAFIILGLIIENGEAASGLPSLKANLPGEETATVSGFSSGGAMATQLHVVHSSVITGMAGFASTFYRCGPGGHLKYSLTCTKNRTEVSQSVKDAQNYEKSGKTDPLSNLKNAKVFVWSGTKDDTVPTAVSKKIADFYQNFASPSNIRFVNQTAIHEFPTDNFGPTCPEPTSSFIGNCNFSGGFEALTSLYGPSIKRAGSVTTQSLTYFNQSEFTAPATPNSIGMDNEGYFYVPKACQGKSQCPLHLFLHGCTLGNQDYQPVFVQRIDYLKLAEANNIIMLFPRAARVPVKNPNGCWNVYGQDGDDYATKDAPQIAAIRKMIQRLYGKF